MKTKPRGLRRRCRNMTRTLAQQTEAFPSPHARSAFWHLHLPVVRGLVDSPKTPFGVRRSCAQTLIDRATHLASLAPQDGSTRVVAAISLPDLWASQIIVFFGAGYFSRFFERNSTTQKWTLLAQNRSLIKEWNLQLPDGF